MAVESSGRAHGFALPGFPFTVQKVLRMDLMRKCSGFGGSGGTDTGLLFFLTGSVLCLLSSPFYPSPLAAFPAVGFHAASAALQRSLASPLMRKVSSYRRSLNHIPSQSHWKVVILPLLDPRLVQMPGLQSGDEKPSHGPGQRECGHQATLGTLLLFSIPNISSAVLSWSPAPPVHETPL